MLLLKPITAYLLHDTAPLILHCYYFCVAIKQWLGIYMCCERESALQCWYLPFRIVFFLCLKQNLQVQSSIVETLEHTKHLLNAPFISWSSNNCSVGEHTTVFQSGVGSVADYMTYWMPASLFWASVLSDSSGIYLFELFENYF